MRNHIGLFSGIGGFELAAKGAGFDTVQMVEIDPFCQAVLEKNFPGVAIHGDIAKFDGQPFYGRIDLITGGFPCQDVARVNRNANGLQGRRSGLWRELLRCIGEIRPRFAVIENVDSLRRSGLGTVLGDLSAIGYDAEWHSIPAAIVAAPHNRQRIWVIAYPRSESTPQTDPVFSPFGVQWDAWSDAGWQDWRRIPAVDWAIPKPGGNRGHDGFSRWMDAYQSQMRALGNAIVPQVAFPILQAIQEALHENETH